MSRSAVPDRRVQLMRAGLLDDGLRKSEIFAPHGAPVWARRRDVSDGERAAAGWIEAVLVSRFELYATAQTRAIGSTDRLVSDGLSFEILGIKDAARRGWIEITARARIDG